MLATCCRASSGRRSYIQRCVPNSGAARRRCTSNNRVKRRSCHCCCCCCCRCQLDCRAKSCHQRACPASDRLRRQLNNCRGCRRVAGGKKARAGCGEGLTRLPGGLRSRRARHARREAGLGESMTSPKSRKQQQPKWPLRRRLARRGRPTDVARHNLTTINL